MSQKKATGRGAASRLRRPRGRPPKPPGTRVQDTHVRLTVWLQPRTFAQLAAQRNKTGTPISTLIDQALQRKRR